MPRFLDPNPDRYEAELALFDAVNAGSGGPPRDGVVFYGSSSIRLWDLATSFPGLDLINRGFGGSHLAECVHHLERVVLPLEPHALIVYAGDNDIAAGGDALHVLDHFVELVGRLRPRLPGTRIYFMSVKPSPSRWHLWPIARRANAMVEAYAHLTGGVSYVDVAGPMFDVTRDGLAETHPPDAGIFIDDMLHLNAAGYAIWNAILQPIVVRESR